MLQVYCHKKSARALFQIPLATPGHQFCVFKKRPTTSVRLGQADRGTVIRIQNAASLLPQKDRSSPVSDSSGNAGSPVSRLPETTNCFCPPWPGRLGNWNQNLKCCKSIAIKRVLEPCFRFLWQRRVTSFAFARNDQLLLSALARPIGELEPEFKMLQV